ncbi:MAG: hypothetical protein U9O87_08055 [Verrucomicrobiota bacterium]|nr:hypothetical protein [Verrucomicrobiota bacterium]
MQSTPIFAHQTSIKVKIIAMGTGAMKSAEKGNADVILVDHRSRKYKFVNIVIPPENVVI